MKSLLFSQSPVAHVTKWQLSEVQILLMPQVLSFVAAKLPVVKHENWKIRLGETHQNIYWMKLDSKMDAGQVKTWCSFLLDRHVRIISRKVRAGVKPKIPLESIWYQYVDSLLASNYLNNLYRFFIGSTCCPDCRVLCKQSGAHHPSQNTHLLGNGRFSGLGDCAAALLRDLTPRNRPYEDSKQSKRHKFRAWLGFFQVRHNLHTSHTQ